MKFRQYIYTATVICALASCADNEVHITDVSHQPLRVTVQPTHVSGSNTGVAEAHELIHDYTLLFVNKVTHRVDARVDRSFADTEREYDEVSFPIEISETSGEDSHKYDVLAFANFTSAMAEKLNVGGLTLASAQEGTTLSSEYLQTLKEQKIDLTKPQSSGVAASYNGFDFAANDTYIPMTGVVDYNATMQYHQPVNVPLVRLMAKLNFKVRNLTCGDSPLTLKKISIRPIQDDEVYLLPHLEGKAPGYYPEHPADDDQKYGSTTEYIPVIPLNSQTDRPDTTHVSLELSADKVLLPQDKSYVNVGALYVNESLAKWHPTKHFTYDLYFVDSENGPHEYRYALSGDDFTAFCRNDNVTIPLTISSPMSLQPEILFYAPIGGYPPSISDKNDEEFFATFRSSGLFAIYPYIYREGERTDIRLTDSLVEFSTDDDHLDENGEACKITHLEVTGDNIFSKKPKYLAQENCFQATLSAEKGHAVIKLTVKMLDSRQIVTKKIHIIHE